jgi:hypothetical protein
VTETTKHLTPAEVRALVPEQHHATVNRWLQRGDGLAVYENHDLGHPDLGHRQFASFGSAAAQLETQAPPDRLPDIGQRINWRYVLVGVYRGGVL